MKKVLLIILSLTMIFTGTIALPASASAAAKPAATSITSVKASVKGFTVKWKKRKATGYQIQVSTSAKFKKSKKFTVKKATVTTKKVTGLKAKKKYYVRVRAYIAKNNKKTFSKWSSAKSVVTKQKKSKKKKKSTKKSYGVYITPTGKKYHFSSDCAGPNATPISLSEAQKYYDPCKKCANG